MLFMAARKGLRSLSVLIAVITATFILVRMMPGGPFDREQALPPEIKQDIEAHYHLSEPWLQQYVLYWNNLLHGQLGYSYKHTDESVSQLIVNSASPTLELGVLSLLMTLMAGIIFGLCWSAAEIHSTRLAGFMHGWILLALSTPHFFLGPLLILVFSFTLDWLPPALWGSPAHIILPLVTLSARPAALVARLVHTEALALLQTDLLRLARAKGLSEVLIFGRHVLKLSLAPILGLGGTLAAGLLSGSFIVELIFAIPGLASHFIDSVLDRDYALVLALTLVYAALLLFFNFIFEVIHSVIDPRTRLS